MLIHACITTHSQRSSRRARGPSTAHLRRHPPTPWGGRCVALRIGQGRGCACPGTGICTHRGCHHYDSDVQMCGTLLTRKPRTGTAPCRPGRRAATHAQACRPRAPRPAPAATVHAGLPEPRPAPAPYQRPWADVPSHGARPARATGECDVGSAPPFAMHTYMPMYPSLGHNRRAMRGA